jgi:hypothetical protein
MKRLIVGSLFVVVWFTARSAFGETSPASVPVTTMATTIDANSTSAAAFDLEWTAGGPFVGAADGATAVTHGYLQLGRDQGPTAMVPASSGISLIVLERTGSGYRFRFDEARSRYLVKLFAGRGRLQRMYVIYPGQEDLIIPFSKLPAEQAFLSIHNESGSPVQTFKLFLEADT